MQKPKLTYFFVAFIIVVLIALFVLAYRAIHQPPAPVHADMHTVLAVDYSGDKELNQNELLLGEDAILTVRTDNNSQMFNSVAALQKLDTNKDYRLDKKDKLFSHLQLLFLAHHGKDKKYVSLQQAGITAIVFDKEGLAQINNTTTTGDNIIIGRAQTHKGKFLLIKIVPVEIKSD